MREQGATSSVVWYINPTGSKIGPGAVLTFNTDESVGPGPWTVTLQAKTAAGAFVLAGGASNVASGPAANIFLGIGIDEVSGLSQLSFISPDAFPDDGDSMKVVAVIQDSSLVVHTHDFGAGWMYDRTFFLANYWHFAQNLQDRILDAVTVKGY